MTKFRKKPIVIEAIKWNGGPWGILNDFCGRNWGRADANDVNWTAPLDKEMVVLWNSIERQWLLCPVGWWIIRGIKGELYSCAPDIFAATYDPVEDAG